MRSNQIVVTGIGERKLQNLIYWMKVLEKMFGSKLVIAMSELNTTVAVIFYKTKNSFICILVSTMIPCKAKIKQKVNQVFHFRCTQITCIETS